MADYKIYLDEELVCSTNWPPMAQAAWHKTSRERIAAHHGGNAILLKDGQELANVQPQLQLGHCWPDRLVDECDLRDVVKAVLLLLMKAGFGAKDIADAMTASGLPTTRSHLDALKGSTQGKRTAVSAAEIVTMLYAAIPLVSEKNLPNMP